MQMGVPLFFDSFSMAHYVQTKAILNNGKGVFMKNNETTKISIEVAHTALCVWEYLQLVFSTKDSSNAYIKYLEQVGVCEMRRIALDLAPKVEAAYNSISDTYDEPFDIEFVPTFLDEIISTGQDYWWLIKESEALKIGQNILLNSLSNQIEVIKKNPNNKSSLFAYRVNDYGSIMEAISNGAVYCLSDNTITLDNINENIEKSEAALYAVGAED